MSRNPIFTPLYIGDGFSDGAPEGRRMEQSSTQSWMDYEPGASKWRQVAHHLRLCRDAFVDAFRLGRLQRFEDELVRHSLSLVEGRVSSALHELRRRGAVVNLDTLRSACRHITHSMTADRTLHEELAVLECLPLDRHSARLHLAVLDRGIRRELPALVSVLSAEMSTAEPAGCFHAAGGDLSARPHRAMCRRSRTG